MQSWSNIYKNYYPLVKSVCIRYVKEETTAEDITQDTFITAIEKAGQLSKKESLKGWIKRIAINKCLDHLKKEKKLQLANEELKYLQDDENQNEMKPSNKSLILNCDYSQDELLKVINKLPGHHREVFNLYVIDKLSHKEIADFLEISINTSKSHLLRARKQVQEELLKIAQNQEEKKKKRLGIFFLLPLGFFTNQLFSSTLNKPLVNNTPNIPSFILQADNHGKFVPKTNNITAILYSTKAIILTLPILFFVVLGIVYLTSEEEKKVIDVSKSSLINKDPMSNISVQKNISDTAINTDKKTENLPKEVDEPHNEVSSIKTKKEPKKDSSQKIKKVVIPKKVYLLKDS